jgi:hypothetical protein
MSASTSEVRLPSGMMELFRNSEVLVYRNYPGSIFVMNLRTGVTVRVEASDEGLDLNAERDAIIGANNHGGLVEIKGRVAVAKRQQ